MTQKQEAIEVISKLPDSATTEGIMAAIHFQSKVDLGLHDLDQSRVVSHHEMKRRLAIEKHD